MQDYSALYTQSGKEWYARMFWNQAHISATTMIEMERTYICVCIKLVYAIRKRLVFKDMQFGSDWFARIFWNPAHKAATTMIDMNRTYILVYSIRKILVCKVILESGTYIVATTMIDMKRAYDLVYAIRKRLVCKDILESGTYSDNNND